MAQDSKDSPLPVCIDLQAFAEKMAKRDSRIPKMVNGVRLVQACFTDIRAANTALEAFRRWMKSERQIDQESALAIENALLTKAVILYGRATHGSSDGGGRGSIQIRGALTPQLQLDHDLIIELRNKAFAHSHPGIAIGGAIWEEQQLLLVATGSGYKPMHTMRTTQRDGASIERLERLVTFALDFFRNRFQNLSSAMVERLHKVGITEQDLLQHETDPTAFFADEEMFREALSRMPT